MTINVAAGAAAYANAAKQYGGSATSVKGTGEGFGDLVQQSLQNAIGVEQQGEAASLAAVTGKADIGSVVEAVNNAELTLQTVLAVRDKVLAAYTEIMHMTV